MIRNHEWRTSHSTLSLDEWISVLISCGCACALCGSDHHLVIDHMIPVSRGGSHSVDNVAPLCKSCNSSKKQRTPLEWLMGVPFRPRPTKGIAIGCRTHAEVREIVEEYARMEKRTLASMADLLVREAIIARMQADGEDTSAIEDLP